MRRNWSLRGRDLRLHPKLTIGVEGTASFTTYDQAVLNNNQVYSAGIYGDWRPGSYFSVQPRFGYTIFESSQTSSSIQGGNLTSWYADLTLAHQATDFLSYSLNAGHEIRPGMQSDAIEDSYIRPNIDWNVIKDVTLQTSRFYEHGTEGGGQQASLTEKNYDWYGGGLSLSYSPMKKVTISAELPVNSEVFRCGVAGIHAEHGWIADCVHTQMNIACPDNFGTVFNAGNYGRRLALSGAAVLFLVLNSFSLLAGQSFFTDIPSPQSATNASHGSPAAILPAATNVSSSTNVFPAAHYQQHGCPGRQTHAGHRRPLQLPDCGGRGRSQAAHRHRFG